MHIDQIFWRPYRYFGTDDLLNIMERTLWYARCSLIFNGLVDRCYPYTMTRQFGFRLDMPLTSHQPSHDVGHDVVNLENDWTYMRSGSIMLYEKDEKIKYCNQGFMRLLKIVNMYMIIIVGFRVLPVD